MPKRKLNWRDFFLLLLPVIVLVLPFMIRNARFWLPDSLQPRQKKYRIVCQSNLRDMALALSQYAQDNENQFPPAIIGSTQVAGWNNKAIAVAQGHRANA